MSLAFYLHYVVVYLVWCGLALGAVYTLSTRAKFQWFAFCVLCTACWYLSAQTHWILTESATQPGWLELIWSMFETMTGGLLWWALCDRD